MQTHNDTLRDAVGEDLADAGACLALHERGGVATPRAAAMVSAVYVIERYSSITSSLLLPPFMSRASSSRIAGDLSQFGGCKKLQSSLWT